jgi:hypothetical protein
MQVTRRHATRWLLALLLALCGCPGGEPASADLDLNPPPGDGAGDLIRDGPGWDSGDALRIQDVRLESNPRNVLSCYVTFKTTAPATVQADYFGGGDLGYRVAGGVSGKTHRLFLFGMRAETRYTIQLTASGTGGGRATASTAYTTGKLPVHVPRARLVLYDPRRAYNGWTLMTVSAGDRTGAILMDPEMMPAAVIYDMQGHPVWYHVHAMPRAGDARYVDGHVLVQSMGSIHERKLSALEVDLQGRVVWRGPLQPDHTVHGHYNHHFEKLANGNYLALRGLEVRRVTGDQIVELTPDHRVVWRWNSFDHVKPQLSLWNGSGNFDYSHGNSLQLDADRDHLYYNARHLSMVLKIDRKTGKVLWRLGRGGDFKRDRSATHPWFQQAHGIEVQPNGNVLLYDNGLAKRGFSRAVEYELDETRMTARIAWQYSGYPREMFLTTYWGDADRLPNGNTLIAAATWSLSHYHQIFEVTPTWERVWEIKLPTSNKGYAVGAYNAQRLVPPLTIISRGAAGEGDAGR